MRFDPTIKIFHGDDGAFENGSVENGSVAKQPDSHPVASVAKAAHLVNSLPVDDGLEMLADQLMADAVHLSAKYPAPKMPDMERLKAEAAAPRRGAMTWNWSVAASLFIALGSSAWLMRAHPKFDSPASFVPPSLAQRADEVSPVKIAAQPIQAEKSTPAGAAVTLDPVGATEPVISVHTPVVDSQDFMDLDPAVREAVMDLVQEGELQQGPVSL